MPSLVLGAVVAGVDLLLLLRHAFRPDRVETRPGLVGSARPNAAPRRPARRARASTAGRSCGTAALVGRRSGAGRRRFGRSSSGPGAAPSPRSREAIKLPAPAEPAKPLPAGVGPGFVTPNADFYRVDTALTVPRIDVDTWRLRIHGMVDRTPSCPSPTCSTGR